MQRSRLLPLYLVVFIDGMGQGIIVPVLAGAMLNPNSHVFLIYASSWVRDFWFELLIGLFFFLWFIGGPILSDISDTIGRKLGIACCLVGTAIGFATVGIGFTFHNLALLLIGRIIGGFTAGSQAIAQAAVIDQSPPDKKAGNIAFILFSLTIGIIAGPIIGGFLADPKIVAWFNFSTPLYIASGLAILNLLLLLFLFKSSKPKLATHHISLARSLTLFIPAMRESKIRNLLIIFFLVTLGWATYFNYITVYMSELYRFTTLDASLFFAVLGLGLSIGLLFLVKLVENKLPAKALVLAGYLLVAVGELLTILIHIEILAWILCLFIGMSLATGYSFIVATFSNLVSAERQGWIMGVNNSIVPLSAGIVALTSGWLSGYLLSLPFSIAIILIILGCIGMSFYKISPKDKTHI